MYSFGLGFSLSLMSLFSIVPTSTNYTLKAFDFGNGGGISTSTSYNLNGTSGTQADATEANGVTILKPGEKPTQDANVPPAATLSNPTATYNKLHAVINNGNNPTDTKFAIAISTDSFTTTKYVKSDDSVGSSLAITDYQTYATWGGAAGFDILGLLPNTSYSVKVSALQGAYTGSAFGPASATVSTQPTTVTFSVATTTNSTPPFTVNFASLNASTVYSADANALVSITTNAIYGGSIYIEDTNGGLFSASKSSTIVSATADLGVATSGYGAQASNLTQTSGGPLTSTAPFNGAANNVGRLSTSLSQILGFSGPVTGGSAQIKFLAKAATGTQPAADYADAQTIVAAMSF